MSKIVIILMILASNLSSPAAEAYNGRPGEVFAARYVDTGYSCGPFGVDVRDDCPVSLPWHRQYPAVPFTWPWSNDLNQTAQQMVAIAAMLEAELQEKEDAKARLERMIEETKAEEERNRRRALDFSNSHNTPLLSFGLALLAIVGLVLIFLGNIRPNFQKFRRWLNSWRRSS